MDYTKRLDEILSLHMPIDKNHAEDAMNMKQALASLIKELVAEAKPYDKQGEIDIDSPAYNDGYYSGAYSAIEKFEQNLLKALESK